MIISSSKFDLAHFQEKTCPSHSHLNIEIKDWGYPSITVMGRGEVGNNKNTANILAINCKL